MPRRADPPWPPTVWVLGLPKHAPSWDPALPSLHLLGVGGAPCSAWGRWEGLGWPWSLSRDSEGRAWAASDGDILGSASCTQQDSSPCRVLSRQRWGLARPVAKPGWESTAALAHPSLVLTPCESPTLASLAEVTDPWWGLDQPGLWSLLAPEPPAQLLPGRLCLSSGPTAAGPEASPSHIPQSRCVPHSPAQPAKDGSQGHRGFLPCSAQLFGTWAGTAVGVLRPVGSRYQVPRDRPVARRAEHSWQP